MYIETVLSSELCVLPRDKTQWIAANPSGCLTVPTIVLEIAEVDSDLQSAVLAPRSGRPGNAMGTDHPPHLQLGQLPVSFRPRASGRADWATLKSGSLLLTYFCRKPALHQLLAQILHLCAMVIRERVETLVF